MNRDLEDKMLITKKKSLETAEKAQTVFHVIGVLVLAVAILIVIFKSVSTRNDETDVNSYGVVRNAPTEDNNSDAVSNIVSVLVGSVVCLVFYIMGDYLYYNLSVKAYTLEFLYNNSCCISDMNSSVVRLNNNMIDGISTICSEQNRNSGNSAGSDSSKV